MGCQAKIKIKKFSTYPVYKITPEQTKGKSQWEIQQFQKGCLENLKSALKQTKPDVRHRCLDLKIWRFSCQQLELLRAPTPRTLYTFCLLCHWLRTYNHYLLIWVQLCPWAESTWSIISVVDRCGQHKTQYLWRSWPLSPIWSQAGFCLIWLFDCTYNSLRCLHLEIWQFSCWQQQQRWQR